jgi:hypothetical protein
LFDREEVILLIDLNRIVTLQSRVTLQSFERYVFLQIMDFKVTNVVCEFTFFSNTIHICTIFNESIKFYFKIPNYAKDIDSFLLNIYKYFDAYFGDYDSRKISY